MAASIKIVVSLVVQRYEFLCLNIFDEGISAWELSLNVNDQVIICKANISLNVYNEVIIGKVNIWWKFLLNFIMKSQEMTYVC